MISLTACVSSSPEEEAQFASCTAGLAQSKEVHLLPSWYLALGTWYLVLGTWYLALGTWYLVLGTWCSVLGTWHLVLGTWYLVLGTWYLGLGTWSCTKLLLPYFWRREGENVHDWHPVPDQKMRCNEWGVSKWICTS